MCGQRKNVWSKISAQRKCVVKKISAQRIRAVKPAVKKSVPFKSALFGATQNVVNQRKKMWSKLGAT